MTRRAVIYTRVSSDKNHGRSVNDQETDCREVCKREGWPVAEVLQDNDRGASRHSRGTRDAYARLTEVLRPGMVLVIWEASRAARDMDTYLALRNLCAERDVLLNYSGRTYDLTEGDSRFSTGLDALIAEKAAEETRDRVRRTLASNAADGRWHGRTIYGYRAVRDPNTGKIIERVLDESTAPIVREAAERVLTGESLRSIGLDFQGRGLRTANGTERWHGYTIRNMVMRPAYAGFRVHKGTLIRGSWEPILSEEEHARLKAVLTDPIRTAHIPRGTPPRYLLSGIAKCGVCGIPLYKSANHGRPIYKCSGRPSHMARELSKVDDVVVQRILQAIEHYRLELVFVTAEYDDDDQPVDPTMAEVGVHLAEARRLQQVLDGYTDDAADGVIERPEYLRLTARLRKRIDAANAAAQSAARVSDPAARILNTPAEDLWASWSLDEKREFIRSAADIVMLPAEGRTFDPDRIQITMHKNLRTQPEGFEHYGPLDGENPPAR
ncbi:recombinase family protein [Rhodococcus sp. IEGM 1401]|uniref:recombinase family protein n=1 Tax=unclassified Rhodococcus (in: high G+C Gram-positive bacteria) TaxID=192944 RepID=UPI0022B3629F|nr:MULTISPECIES: recombinase family protein [unclassified Rhodococcus (in: high G+C Gram-positive bacteria)]MCZ4560704.1 recombinase family protein [Rhodococcus sp. IEGM 1401]MDI9920832.1 recombinase family protein [Rhodococcus sp. IEGM 1372]MDV8033131.1 recombinase family protein [Rhodococcus sp. IEGM 1414]